MKLILRIAWRNIFRHKGKTAVIGFILFLGALLLTIGNGIITGLNYGLQQNVVDSFSGNIVLVSNKQLSESVLASMTGQTMEPIVGYKSLEPEIKKLPGVADILPTAIGYVWVLNETGQPIDQYILGVDFESYRSFFHERLEVIEGKYPVVGQRGALVNSVIRKNLYDFSGFWAYPVDTSLVEANLSPEAKLDGAKLRTQNRLIFMGLSQKNSSLDIPCDVLGVFKFKALNQLLGMYSLVDIESLRECMGYFTAETVNAPPSTEQTKLLAGDSALLEESFDFSFESSVSNGKSLTDQLITTTTTTAKLVNQDWRDGTFNAIFVRLTPGTNTDQAVKLINAQIKKNNIPLKAIPWNVAIGMMGQMAVIMKSALLVFVSFIFVVAIIIIMNTLSLAAMERVTEIGMMRAVGARRSLISAMFIAETGLLAAFFGGLGIVCGIISVKVLASLQLTTQNEMMQIFYGGDSFHPMLGTADITICVIALIVVTLLSVLYPVHLARRITPLDAMSRD